VIGSRFPNAFLRKRRRAGREVIWAYAVQAVSQVDPTSLCRGQAALHTLEIHNVATQAYEVSLESNCSGGMLTYPEGPQWAPDKYHCNPQEKTRPYTRKVELPKSVADSALPTTGQVRATVELQLLAPNVARQAPATRSHTLQLSA
jgi:hypothetical protein